MYRSLGLKHWILCQIVSFCVGYFAWSVTQNIWIGIGAMVASVVAYTFLLAGRVAPATTAKRGASVPLSRQQRRAMQRKAR